MERTDVQTRDSAIVASLQRNVPLHVICGVFDVRPETIQRIAASADCTLPVSFTGPDTIYSTRNAEMVRRALEGEDFTAISHSYGVTRERVRQIIRAVTGLSAKDLEGVRTSARDAIKIELARDTAAQEPEASCAAIARRCGLPTVQVEQLLGVAEAARRRPDRRILSTTSEEESLAALRRVASLPGGEPLSGPFYDKHRRDSLTSTRLIQVFGTWTEACQRAGVVPRAAARTDYRQRWSREDCLSWVARYLESTEKPSFARYDLWARSRAGAPSGGTVRLRCGKWIETVRAAALLVESPQPPHA